MNTMAAANNKFYHLLAAGNIICGTRARTAEEVIRELSAQVTRNLAGYDADKIFESVMLREQIMPTVITPGLAVPHARIAIAGQPVIALATSADGIAFDQNKGKAVKVVILMLTPADDPDLHLQVFSALSKDFAKVELTDRLATLHTPEEVIKCLADAASEIPQFLRARDVMNPHPAMLLENNTLQEAITLFATCGCDEAAVVDDDHELRGIISLTDLFKFSLPEHILWLDDLSSVYRFEPFSEVLHTAGETKVADVMHEDVTTVNAEIPAVQLAKLFLTEKLQNLFVLDSQEKLAGVVELKNFAARLFWE